MLVSLVNWSTSEVVRIECINWEVNQYQFYFYSDKDNKIKQQCFSTRMWDVREIQYD